MAYDHKIELNGNLSTESVDPEEFFGEQSVQNQPTNYRGDINAKYNKKSRHICSLFK